MSERKNEFGQPIGREMFDWTERRCPRREALAGRYARVEPVHVGKHAKYLFDAYREAPDARDWTYLAVARPGTAAQFHGDHTELAKSDKSLHFAILGCTAGKPLGTAALTAIDTAQGLIEIGHVAYSPRLQRMSAGTEAVYLLLCHVFDAWGYRRCVWRCKSLDVASRAAAERPGCTPEGMLRDTAVYKRRRCNTACYAIRATEWPRLRGALERWLDPSTFDARGLQQDSRWAIREGLKGPVHAAELSQPSPSGAAASGDLAGHSATYEFCNPAPGSGIVRDRARAFTNEETKQWTKAADANDTEYQRGACTAGSGGMIVWRHLCSRSEGGPTEPPDPFLRARRGCSHAAERVRTGPGIRHREDQKEKRGDDDEHCYRSTHMLRLLRTLTPGLLALCHLGVAQAAPPDANPKQTNKAASSSSDETAAKKEEALAITDLWAM